MSKTHFGKSYFYINTNQEDDLSTSIETVWGMGTVNGKEIFVFLFFYGCNIFPPEVTKSDSIVIY